MAPLDSGRNYCTVYLQAMQTCRILYPAVQKLKKNKKQKQQPQTVSLCAYIGEYFVNFETAVLKQTKTSYVWLSWRYLFDDAGEIYVTFINAFEHFYDNFLKKHLQNFITFDEDLTGYFDRVQNITPHLA